MDNNGMNNNGMNNNYSGMNNNAGNNYSGVNNNYSDNAINADERRIASNSDSIINDIMKDISGSNQSGFASVNSEVTQSTQRSYANSAYMNSNTINSDTSSYIAPAYLNYTSATGVKKTADYTSAAVSNTAPNNASGTFSTSNTSANKVYSRADIIKHQNEKNEGQENMTPSNSPKKSKSRKKSRGRAAKVISIIVALGIIVCSFYSTGVLDSKKSSSTNTPSPVNRQVNASNDIDAKLPRVLLVNKENGLPKDYVPQGMVIPNVTFGSFVSSESRHMLPEAAAALEQLFADAKAEGINLIGVSAYRSYSTQSAIYYNNVATKGYAHANVYSAQPGLSEHQTGYAIDVSCSAVGCNLVEAFADTAEGQWLKEHCSDYGFIIRYGQGMTDITGYAYEPWHIRYVGVEVAKYVEENGITLDQYQGALPYESYSAAYYEQATTEAMASADASANAYNVLTTEEATTEELTTEETTTESKNSKADKKNTKNNSNKNSNASNKSSSSNNSSGSKNSNSSSKNNSSSSNNSNSNTGNNNSNTNKPVVTESQATTEAPKTTEAQVTTESPNISEKELDILSGE